MIFGQSSQKYLPPIRWLVCIAIGVVLCASNTAFAKSRKAFAKLKNIQKAKALQGHTLYDFHQKTKLWQKPLRHLWVSSGFGYRSGDRHDGVDFKAKSGEPIYAADHGRVIYASQRISGYGKMVILKHESGLATLYAHQSKLRVRQGDWVRRGQLIGFVGSTGRSSGAHLHFEVRDGIRALDPMQVVAQYRMRPVFAQRRVAFHRVSRIQEYRKRKQGYRSVRKGRRLASASDYVVRR